MKLERFFINGRGGIFPRLHLIRIVFGADPGVQTESSIGIILSFSKSLRRHTDESTRSPVGDFDQSQEFDRAKCAPQNGDRLAPPIFPQLLKVQRRVIMPLVMPRKLSSFTLRQVGCTTMIPDSLPLVTHVLGYLAREGVTDTSFDSFEA